jgi:flagellar basal-body rod protein FlgF
MGDAIQGLGAGMLALWQRHEVLANNLANASTAGFKRDDLLWASAPATAERLASPALLAAPGVPLPAGPPVMVQWTDFSQGPIRETGRPLDVALNGPGFFVVETPAGPRYTRAGSFDVGAEAFLVTSGGARVLGERGPIEIRGGAIRVTEAGVVEVGGQVVDTLRVVDFRRPGDLVKEGHSLFVPRAGDIEPVAATGYQVLAGHLEGPNTSPVETMVAMIELMRTFEAYQRAIQAADEIDRQAATELGRTE